MNFTLANNSTSNSTSLYIGNCLLVDPSGYPYIEWMYNSMGQCVHSPLEQSSFYVGLGSLVLYVISGIPQVIENFVKGNAEGLSPLTLAQFIIGDSCNLLGAILTNQLFTQILLAIYFVTIEVVLIAQYIGYKLRDWYRKRKQGRKELLRGGEEESDKKNHTAASCSSLTCTPLEEHCSVEFISEDEIHQLNSLQDFPKNYSDEEMKQTHSTLIVSILVLVLVFVVLLTDSSNMSFTHYSSATDSLTNTKNQMVYGRRLFSIHEEESTNEKYHNSVEFPPKSTQAIIGFVIGFISTTCSIGSRIAQIVKNFTRSNTIGMNPLLFGCSVLGNILYSGSIFLFSVDGSFLLNKIPWLTSSLVNICLDSFIISQYVFYTFIRKNKPKTEKLDEKSQSELQEQTIVEKLKELEV